MSEPLRTCLEQPSEPGLKLPAVAANAHMHVSGPPERFAYAASRNLTLFAAPRQRSARLCWSTIPGVLTGVDP